MDLLLDVYRPVRTEAPKMPVVVFIHGGSFMGGSHKKPEFVRMVTSLLRGWVALDRLSRAAPHFGTVPANYPEVPEGARTTGQPVARPLSLLCRDAKAAIRWIRSKADEYSMNTDYITAIGGSAGSFIALALGVTNEEDCVNELSDAEDPTLAGTHREHASSIRTIIDHWGGTSIVRALEAMTPGARFDASDPPISIVHGTLDPTVPFSEAEAIKAEYDRTGAPYAWHPRRETARALGRARRRENLTEPRVRLHRRAARSGG